jgi:hypothetical protein
VADEAIDDPAQAPRPGIDRRTIIKRAAAAGALIWTAPVILDSVASPTGAITCSGACVRVQFPPNVGIVCNATSQAVGATCTTTSPSCTTTTNLGAGFTYASVCITPPLGGCGPEDPGPVFSLNATSTTCFTATGASCSAPRQFLAAQAGTVDVAGNPGCVTAFITPTGTQVQFSLPSGSSWTFFQFLIGCSCS